MDTTLPLLDPPSSALVLIDLQAGIVARDTAPLPARDVVRQAVLLARTSRRVGALVVLVHVVATPGRPDALHPRADEAPPATATLPPGWSDIVPELGPEEGDVVIAKRQWGAFYGTDLDLQLRRRRIETIVLAGISTNIGVESTARDAYERGYQLVFASDAMAASTEADHRQTVTRIFPRIGRVRDTARIVAALGGREAS
ncbi:MAG TPA: hydrolase [Candidatus Saccharimonadales bacterium]|nr:hydrolase [Candidatus Saccharimonadales bacterium]